MRREYRGGRFSPVPAHAEWRVRWRALGNPAARAASRGWAWPPLIPGKSPGVVMRDRRVALTDADFFHLTDLIVDHYA